MLRSFVAFGCTIAASALVVGSAAAQTGALTGAIYDPGGKTGVAGVEVRIAGTDLVAITTADGRYTIAGVPAGSQKIEIARSGYGSLSLAEIRIRASDTSHVYVALTAAPADDAAKAAADAPEEAGPMYIIDGVILAVPPTIDPKNIESVEVIKGEAARKMYGKRAGTGVIVITTRKAPSGR